MLAGDIEKLEGEEPGLEGQTSSSVLNKLNFRWGWLIQGEIPGRELERWGWMEEERTIRRITS